MNASVTARRMPDAAHPCAAWTSKLSSLGSVGGAKPLVAFIRAKRETPERTPVGGEPRRALHVVDRPDLLNDQNRLRYFSTKSFDMREGACPSWGWGHAGRQGRRDAG